MTRCLRALDDSSTVEKATIRVIIGVLSAFHFPVKEAALKLDAAVGGSAAGHRAAAHALAALHCRQCKLVRASGAGSAGRQPAANCMCASGQRAQRRVSVWRLALLAVADRLVIPLPKVVLAATILAGTLLAGWRLGMELYSLRPQQATHSPGANDNASGVGVLLAVAEHFAKHPPRGTQLEFCLTGAEETGMHGAAARAAQLPRGAPQVLMLNLDMVGAGSALRFITRDGVLWQYATSVRLNKAIRIAHSAANGIWYTLRSADYLPFLQRGIAASGLQTSGSAEAELAYHTQYDTPQVIDTGALDLTANAVVGVVRQLDLGR